MSSENSTSNKALLLSLPYEVITMIFKEQTSQADVRNFSQACRLTHQAYLSAKEAIDDAVALKAIDAYHDALRLAELQELDGPMLPGAKNSLVKRLIANARALPLIEDRAGRFFKNFPISYTDPDTNGLIYSEYRFCKVHNPNNLTLTPPPPLPHEKARLAACWYFLNTVAHAFAQALINHELKRNGETFAVAEHMPEWEQFHREISIMTPAQLYIHQSISFFLHHEFGEGPPFALVDGKWIIDTTVYEYDDPIARGWRFIRNVLYEEYVDWLTENFNDRDWKLNGPFDGCAGNFGISLPCEPRDPELWIWEVESIGRPVPPR